MLYQQVNELWYLRCVCWLNEKFEKNKFEIIEHFEHCKCFTKISIQTCDFTFKCLFFHTSFRNFGERSVQEIIHKLSRTVYLLPIKLWLERSKCYLSRESHKKVLSVGDEHIITSCHQPSEKTFVHRKYKYICLATYC